MEENTAQNQIIEIPVVQDKPWLKFALFSVLGMVLVGGAVFVGIQIYKISNVKSQIAPLRQGFAGQAKLTPTQAPVATSTPILPPETTPLPDETADWKTYTNIQYGFEFRYPNYLSPMPSNSENHGVKLALFQKFVGPINTTLLYLIFNLVNNARPDGTSYLSLEERCQPCSDIKKITVGGVTAADFGSSAYFFSKDNRFIYEFGIYTESSSAEINTELLANTLKLILSTFRFLE
ncbi:hypothetical protein FJY90_01110 [Candidatus Gottesmanbacteria bacterium]|nr:hypothetical protein [Candidatus Gottesmanbacteria bacterium]